MGNNFSYVKKENHAILFNGDRTCHCLGISTLFISHLMSISGISGFLLLIITAVTLWDSICFFMQLAGFCFGINHSDKSLR